MLEPVGMCVCVLSKATHVPYVSQIHLTRKCTDCFSEGKLVFRNGSLHYVRSVSWVLTVVSFTKESQKGSSLNFARIAFSLDGKNMLFCFDFVIDSIPSSHCRLWVMELAGFACLLWSRTRERGRRKAVLAACFVFVGWIA